MAIIVCKECDHRVSDQAASCPGCGAPMAAASNALHQGQRRALIVVIGAAAVALMGAVYWFDARRASSPSSARGETFSRPDQISSAEARDDLKAPARTVYQTTAERLYQDYAANGVAMQTKIAGSLIRITGRISEIDEDASGNPLVKLAAGNDNSINMTLGSDEVAAAAQLARGQTVDIQCDRMRRVQGSPEGSRCNLVLVQAAASASAPAIRAPLPAPQVNPVSPAKAVQSVASPHVVPGGRMARKQLPPSMIAMVPAVPSEPESLTPAQGPATATPLGAAEVTTVSPIASTPSGPANSPAREASAQPLRLTSIADASSAQDPSAANASSALTPTAAMTSTPAVTSTAPITPATAVAPADSVAPDSAAPLAAVASTAAATSTVTATSTAAPTSALTAPTAAVASDDLAAVRAADPQAAEHIASYCASTSGVGGGAATCRRDEQEAWARLVQHNEFPALDNSIRLKCSQPPFPDSYRAKEICAKYELRIY